MDDFSNNQYLWIDPFEDPNGIGKNVGSVLLAEDILKYVEKFGVIFANDCNFNEKGFKGASYSMRPHYKDAWYFNENGKQERLGIDEDDQGSYYLVKRNSLVYIKIREKLILPYYIIGRHNLTIKYVYQGLLLGTGPQVDPGYEGNLYIPLHNLTNDDVKVYLDRSFVSIDFVRTSKFVLDNGTPKTRKELKVMYPNRYPIPVDKLNRVKLSDYLGGSKPSSSLGMFVPQFAAVRSKMDKFISKRNVIDWAMVATFAALFAGVAFGFYQVFQNLESRIDNTVQVTTNYDKDLDEIKNQVKAISQDVKAIQTKPTEIHLLYDQIKSLRSQLDELERRSVARPTKAVK